ncbi:MAG: redox-regulated ATPase YchF [Deltaproteobacteria bacterium]|nr:redox-regulated ATPase YchF [Deltaproteobacteria bacterium]
MKAGIVGLPNVGKSTLFNALTAAGAESANYPFCTIEPNVGIVKVPDPRLKVIQSYIPTDSVIPAMVEIVDIAGLVRGASKGEGLGNQFLSHIRNVDAIIHMVRCFENENVIHVEGRVDPIEDIEVIDTELALSDLDSVERQLPRLQKRVRGGEREAADQLKALEVAYELLKEGKPARAGDWSDEQRRLLKLSGLLTYKPVLYVCNVNEEDAAAGNALSARVAARAAAEGSQQMVICAQFEAEASELDDEDERRELLMGLGVSELGLDRLARGVYELLGLQTYFTAGKKEIRAWTVHRGATAPQGAGVIHSDFERGFIRANIYALADLEEHKSEVALKAVGKIRSEGKEYVLKDGDICHFLFNV